MFRLLCWLGGRVAGGGPGEQEVAAFGPGLAFDGVGCGEAAGGVVLAGAIGGGEGEAAASLVVAGAADVDGTAVEGAGDGAVVRDFERHGHGVGGCVGRRAEVDDPRAVQLVQRGCDEAGGHGRTEEDERGEEVEHGGSIRVRCTRHRSAMRHATHQPGCEQVALTKPELRGLNTVLNVGDLDMPDSFEL